MKALKLRDYTLEFIVTRSIEHLMKDTLSPSFHQVFVRSFDFLDYREKFKIAFTDEIKILA